MNAESANVTRVLANCAQSAHTYTPVGSKGADNAVDSNTPSSSAIQMAAPTAPPGAASRTPSEEKPRLVRKVTFIDPAKLKAMGLDVQIANALKKQSQDALPPAMQKVAPKNPRVVLQQPSGTKLELKTATTVNKDAKPTKTRASTTKNETKPTKKDANTRKKNSKPSTKADAHTEAVVAAKKVLPVLHEKVLLAAGKPRRPTTHKNIASESRASLPTAAEGVPSSSRLSVEAAPTQMAKILDSGVVLKPMPASSTRNDLTPVKAILNQFLIRKAAKSVIVDPNSSAPQKQARDRATAKTNINSNSPLLQKKSQVPSAAMPKPASVLTPPKTHEASFKNFIISQHINEQRGPLPVTPPPFPKNPTVNSPKDPLKTFVISKERKRVNMALNPFEAMPEPVQSHLSPATAPSLQPVAGSPSMPISAQDKCLPMISVKDSEKTMWAPLPTPQHNKVSNANRSLVKNKTIKVVTCPKDIAVPLREFLVQSAISGPDIGFRTKTQGLRKENNNNIDTVTEDNHASKIQPLNLVKGFSTESPLNEATKMLSPLRNKSDHDKHTVGCYSSSSIETSTGPMQPANIFDNQAFLTEQLIATARTFQCSKQPTTPVKILENKILSHNEKINISGLFAERGLAPNNKATLEESSYAAPIAGIKPPDLELGLKNRDEQIPATLVKPLVFASFSDPNTEHNLDQKEGIKMEDLENRDEEIPATPVKPLEFGSRSDPNTEHNLDINPKMPSDAMGTIGEGIKMMDLENPGDKILATPVKLLAPGSVSNPITEQNLDIHLQKTGNTTARDITRKAHSESPKKAPVNSTICSQNDQIEALRQLEKLVADTGPRKSSKTISDKPKTPRTRTRCIIQPTPRLPAAGKEEEETSAADLSAVDFVYCLSLDRNAAPCIELTPEESRLTELVRRNILQRKQRKRPNTERASVAKTEDELPECSIRMRRRLSSDKKSEVEESSKKSLGKDTTECQSDVEILKAIFAPLTTAPADGDCLQHIPQFAKKTSEEFARNENLSQDKNTKDAAEASCSAEIADLVTPSEGTMAVEEERRILNPFPEQASKALLGPNLLETALSKEIKSNTESKAYISDAIGSTEYNSKEIKSVPRTISVIKHMKSWNHPKNLQKDDKESTQSELRDSSTEIRNDSFSQSHLRENSTTGLRNIVQAADQRDTILMQSEDIPMEWKEEHSHENLRVIKIEGQIIVDEKSIVEEKDSPISTNVPGELAKNLKHHKDDKAVVLEYTRVVQKDPQQDIYEDTSEKTNPESDRRLAYSNFHADYEHISSDVNIGKSCTMNFETSVAGKMTMAETISRSQLVIIYEDPSIPQTIVPYSPMKQDVKITNTTDKDILVLQIGAADGKDEEKLRSYCCSDSKRNVTSIEGTSNACVDLSADGAVIDDIKSCYRPTKNNYETIILQEDKEIRNEGVLINGTELCTKLATDTGLTPMVSYVDNGMREDDIVVLEYEDTSKFKKILQNPAKRGVEYSGDEIPKIKGAITEHGIILAASEHMPCGAQLTECTADTEPSTSKGKSSIKRQYTPPKIEVTQTQEKWEHVAVDIRKKGESIGSSSNRTKRKRFRKTREFQKKFDDSSSESDGFAGFADSPNTSGRLKRGFESIETAIAGRNSNSLKKKLASSGSAKIAMGKMCRHQVGITPIKKHFFNNRMPFKKRWELAEHLWEDLSATDDTSATDDCESALEAQIGVANFNLTQNKKNDDKVPNFLEETPAHRTSADGVPPSLGNPIDGTESKRISPTAAGYCNKRLGSSRHKSRNKEKTCAPQTKHLLRISGEESESKDGSKRLNASHKSASSEETVDSTQHRKLPCRRKKCRLTAVRKHFRIFDSDEASGGVPKTEPEIYNNESNDTFDDFSDTGELIHTEPDKSEEEPPNPPLSEMEFPAISGERTEMEKLPYKGKKRGRKPKNIISAADCQERFENYAAIKSEEGAASTTNYGLNALTETETGRLPYSGKKRGPKPKNKSANVESVAVKLEKGQTQPHNESTGESDVDNTSTQKVYTGKKRGRPPKSYYQILNDGELESGVNTGDDRGELSPDGKRCRRKLQANFSYDESQVESDIYTLSAAPKSDPNIKLHPTTKGKRGRKPKQQLVDQSNDANRPAPVCRSAIVADNITMLSEPESAEEATFKMPRSKPFPYNKELETLLTVNIASSIAERIKQGRKSLSSEMNSTFDPRLLLVRQRSQMETEENLHEENSGSGPWQCGLCLSSTTPSAWMSHLSRHYGIGWVYGRDAAPDLFNRSVVLAAISNYFKKMGKIELICRMCNRSYRSALGLLLHIEMCGSSDTRVSCEYCKKEYSRLTLSGHLRLCADRLKQNRDDTDNAASSATANSSKETFSNSGRVKRVSLIKAEKKLRAIEEDSHLDIDLNQYFKPCMPSMAGFYDEWNKDLKSSGKAYCPKDDCSFTADNLTVMESHIKLKLNPQYKCLVCKDQQIYGTHNEALKHFIARHKSAIDDFANNHSDSSVKLEDETTTDDAFQSSADDRDENIVISDETFDEPNAKRKRPPWRPQSNESKRIYSRRVNGNIADFVTNSWKNFVNENYSATSLFPYALPQYKENRLSDACAPQAASSMKFSLAKVQDLVGTFGKMKTSGEWSQLNLYEAAEEQNGVLIYLGSPVKVLAWAPLPPNIPHQYLAVTCRKDIFKHTRQANPEISPTLVYFFKIATQISAGSNQTELLYALRICDGPVHCLAFLPSGGYSSNKNRLGLLAVGTASRDVKIYALPLKVVKREGGDKRLNVIDLKPAMVLALDLNLRPHDMPAAQCLRLSWSETNGHSHVAAAFSNGFLGIWDISSDEADNLNCSLLDGVRNFSPLNYFFIGEKRITGLCMHYDTEGPRWLAASSAARKVIIYDIRNISQPLLLKVSLPKNIVSSIDWSPIWEQLVASYGDIGPFNGCCAGSISPLNLVFNNNKIDQMICTCTDAHYNPVDNVIVCSTDNGELVFLNPSDTHFDDLHNSHVSNMPRAYVLTDIKSLTGEPLEDCKISTDGKISGGKLYEEDYKDKYGLVIGSIKKYSTDQKKNYLAKTRVPPRNLLQFMRINSVRWNPNFGASDMVAAGYENGLMRILGFNKKTFCK